MWVKFIGQGELSFEYNGKRFFFNRQTPPKEITPAVYDHVKAAGTVEASGLVPCDPPVESQAEAMNSPAVKALVKERDDLVAENKKLKAENEKLLRKLEQTAKPTETRGKKK